VDIITAAIIAVGPVVSNLLNFFSTFQIFVRVECWKCLRTGRLQWMYVPVSVCVLIFFVQSCSVLYWDALKLKEPIT